MSQSTKLETINNQYDMRKTDEGEIEEKPLEWILRKDGSIKTMGFQNNLSTTGSCETVIIQGKQGLDSQNH